MRNDGDDMSRDPTEIARPSESIPTRIGHYTIRGVIASGGMGTVFKAVQENPRRAVAIKVMKAGVNTPSELRRFEFEAQLLGRLRHPGIAQIYEAGTHCENGSSVPFFAMEYIPNAKNIREYASSKDLGTRERLEIFVRVCDAVHHGHQKGIIHRDLKPGNIMVGPNGSPRVIDFGVARATDSDMALTHHQTDVGQLVGTVQYMSPEQCEADPHDIDTRSDVYSLGVVLYELLCETLPYDIKKVPIYEATRIIRDSDPPRPSKINPKLRGDLETILVKALEKDRDRRYQSAAELGQDIRRYLLGDAITARPASSVYQLRVFARRNKGLLTAVSAVAVVLIAGVAVSSILYFRSLNYQIQNYELEAKARGAQNYLEDVIGSANLWGDTVPVSRLLQTFGNNIDDRFADHPEVEAEVRLELAKSYNFLTMFKGGPEVQKFSNLAEEHFRKALELSRELYGENNLQILPAIEETASHYGSGFDLNRAAALRREALRIRQSVEEPDIEGIMKARNRLANVLIDMDELDEAKLLNDEALEYYNGQFGEDDPAKLAALATQARIRQLEGDHEAAVADRLELLETARRLSGAGSESEHVALRGLASAYVAQGRLGKAAEIYNETIPITVKQLGIQSWLVEEYEFKERVPTILVFWESWCPYCQLYLPQLDKLSAENLVALQVIGMTALDSGREEAESFVKRNNITFPNASVNDEILQKLDITGYPTAVALYDDLVLWKGHPKQISRVFLQGMSKGLGDEP